MGLEKVGLNLAQRTASWLKTTGKTSILQTKPINSNEIQGLRYTHNLGCDTVSFSTKRLQEINKKADELLTNIKEDFEIEYIEKYLPDVIDNCKKGKIEIQDEINYYTFKKLEDLRKKNPEVFVFLGLEKSPNRELQNIFRKYKDTAYKTLDGLSLENIKNNFSDIDNALGYKKNLYSYMHMLIMKKYNPKTYEYIMSINPTSFNRIGNEYFRLPSETLLKTLTPNQLLVMQKSARVPLIIQGYVADSNAFMKDKELVDKLSNTLTKSKLCVDVELYRGDQTVGMFDNVGINKDFSVKIRQLLDANKKQAKATKISGYTGLYGDLPNTNLYDFISQKETLTLADAMQVVKYGDNAFLNEVTNRISKAKIVDTRFKSYSIDRGFAEKWSKGNAKDNTNIIQKALVKKDTQGAYHYQTGNNNQYEVVLNNTPKEITFQNVFYNKDTDTFELETIVQNILN